MDNIRRQKTGLKGVKRVTVRRRGKTYIYYRHLKTGRNLPGQPNELRFRRELEALDNDLTGVNDGDELTAFVAATVIR